MTCKVKDLTPNATNVDIEGVIESVGEPRTVNLKTGGQAQVAEAVLKDETGSIKLSLWDAQIKMVKANSVVEVLKGYVTSYQGTPKLNVGKFGSFGVKSF